MGEYLCGLAAIILLDGTTPNVADVTAAIGAADGCRLLYPNSSPCVGEFRIGRDKDGSAKYQVICTEPQERKG